MAVQTRDLWSLAQERQHIDPLDLTAAIEAQVICGDLDYRTRLLIRDSMRALRHYWGPKRVADWLQVCPVGEKIESIYHQRFDEDGRGFPSLMWRVINVTRPETIREFLQEIHPYLPPGARIRVGGAVALILAGYLLRRTERVDLVDETRAEFALLPTVHAGIEDRYGLGFARFPPRYLPQNWQQRVQLLASYGHLGVYLIDGYDVLLGKLISEQDKDLDDLREVAPKLDKETLVRRLNETMISLLAEPDLRQQAEHNWYIVYGESLPS